MRNLKKVLSLVLALAMVLSICMVGAGAVNYDDFTDEESIVKKQAVETLVSLDIIKGYNDGATFNPTGNVTRAEMATMICRVLAGGDNMIVDATKPVATYADIAGHWAESYIEYCTSLGIVSGKSPSSFDPQANVTAAEAAKMVMTTLGYNADIEQFKGIGWDINVMAKANTLQLLDNLQGEISSSVPMTREQVAQLLFNALDDPMVQNYVGTSANLWIGSGANAYQQTLLESKFKAEKVVGVVVANEWADLDSDEPLGKGRTRVIVLGTDNMPTKTELTLNLTTGLDKIGESIIVYRDTNSNRVIFGDWQDTGLNRITEFTTETKDITKGEGAVDKSAKDAEQYVNFDDGLTNTYTARARFTVRLPEDVDIVTGNNGNGTEDEIVIEETFNRNNDVTFANYAAGGADADARVLSTNVLTVLEAAYDEVNHNNSTKAFLTNADNYDTFEDWCDVYLTTKSVNGSINALANENGNYIKVVDYNNDGDIDYVLKTVYTASTVKRIAKDGEITLTDTIGVETDCNYIVTSGNDKTALTSEDELAAGDVVLYTVIDGTAYITLAETLEHVRIDSVHKNNITVTTMDGDTYNESGVNMIFKVDAMDDLGGVTRASADNWHSIISMAGKTDYDIFFDLYGNIVAYRTSLNSGTFTLLTDGWYAEWKDRDEYSVKAFIDGKIGTYDVDGGAKTFVIEGRASLNNSWGMLKPFGSDMDTVPTTDDFGYRTTVASYALDDETLDLTAVDRVNSGNRRNVDVVALDVVDIKKGDNKYLTGDAYESVGQGSGDWTAKNAFTYPEPAKYLSSSLFYDENQVGDDRYLNENVRVRPRTDTVYYYVYNSGNKVVVDTYEGYTNAPSVDKADISGMYAVGTEYGDYYIANVIVVELTRYRTGGELIFVYDAPERVDQVGKDHFDIIRKDGTAESNVLISHDGALEEGKLYLMYEDGDGYTVAVADEVDSAAEFKENNLWIGTVDQFVDGVREKDYVWIIPQYGPDALGNATQPAAVAAGAADEKRLELTGDKYYTLGYELNRQNEQVATLTPADPDDVMAEKVGKNEDQPNHVLVYANKDGQVIWAVSFNPDERPFNGYATQLWEDLRPVYVAGPATVDVKDLIDKLTAFVYDVQEDGATTTSLADVASWKSDLKTAIEDDTLAITGAQRKAATALLGNTMPDGGLVKLAENVLAGLDALDDYKVAVEAWAAGTYTPTRTATPMETKLAAAKADLLNLLAGKIVKNATTGVLSIDAGVNPSDLATTISTTLPNMITATADDSLDWTGTLLRDMALQALTDGLTAYAASHDGVTQTLVDNVIAAVDAAYDGDQVTDAPAILELYTFTETDGTVTLDTTGATAAAGSGQPLNSASAAVSALSSAVNAAEGWTLNVGATGANITFTTVVGGEEIVLANGTPGKVGTAIKVKINNTDSAKVNNYILTLTPSGEGTAQTIEVGEIAANSSVEQEIQVPAGTWTLSGAIVTSGLTVTVSTVNNNSGAATKADITINGVKTDSVLNKQTGDQIVIGLDSTTDVIIGVSSTSQAATVSAGELKDDGTYVFTLSGAAITDIAVETKPLATLRSDAKSDVSSAVTTAKALINSGNTGKSDIESAIDDAAATTAIDSATTKNGIDDAKDTILAAIDSAVVTAVKADIEELKNEDGKIEASDADTSGAIDASEVETAVKAIKWETGVTDNISVAAGTGDNAGKFVITIAYPDAGHATTVIVEAVAA